tara:strand:- start:1871 stop:3052 length:1182 start_codon:yes stop_codon:yes gene_type:complete
MPKNRKLQNIIGTEHITDSAEAAIAAQATVGDIVGDTTPQLGGNLDVNGNDIVSVSNGDIELAPNGTGQVIFKGNSTKGAGQFKLNCEVNTHGIIIKGPPHSAAASYTLTLPNTDGSADQVLKTDGAGNLDWVAQSGGGGVTIQDEGSPLSTTGTTLNFVGSGVVASGTGATKTITIAGGGGSAFAPTRQVFRKGTNPRTTLTALTPYGFPSFSNTNHPTTLERIFFFPFIAPETVAITKLSVYVSSANASSPNVLLGIYTATESGSGSTLQRIPNALQMTASVATTSTGYQDATVSAYSGGSTTITEGTLYYAAYARAAATAGGSQLQGVSSSSRAQIGVSIGNANQVAINNGSGQGGEHSDGDALAASYSSTYPNSNTTSTTTLHIMYRVD